MTPHNGPSVGLDATSDEDWAVYERFSTLAPSLNWAALSQLQRAGFVLLRGAEGLTHGDTLERFGFAPFPHDATPVWRVVEREP